MGVIFTISVIFLEVLTALTAFVVFCFLLKEYLARRKRPLLFVALSFLTLSVSVASLFFGQILHAYGVHGIAEIFITSRLYLACFEALWLFLALVDFYSPQTRGTPLLFALGMPTASFTAALMFPSEIVSISGLAVPYLSLWQYLFIFSSSCAAALCMAFVGLRKGAKSADRFFAKAAFFGIMVVLLRTASIAFEVALLFPIGLAVELPYIAYLFFAAVAKDNPDRLVAERPFTFFTRRLILKAAALNATLFWALAFLVLAITSTYFVTSSIDNRKLGLRRDVHFFSRSFAGSSVLFLEETTRLAEQPALKAMLEGKTVELPPALASFLERDGQKRIMRFIDGDGVVRFSSHSPREVGRTVSSEVVMKALAGTKVAATEMETELGQWMLRAAVPVVTDDGKTAGVLLGTDLSDALDFSDYTAISPVLASGYGYVAENGDSVYQSGEDVDVLTKNFFKKTVGTNGGTYSGEMAGGDLVFLERVNATDGTSNGYFYVILRRAMLDSEVFRILAVVVFIVLLALMFMTAILIFTIATTILHPVMELRDASHRVEKEDYDVHVHYRSPDELGELATAFNRMSAAIAERTANLREAVRQQQDFLDHSVRDMRAPLNVFRWTLEMMRFGDTGRMTKEQLELLEQMHQTNERLVRLVQNLQDVLRLDQGKMPMRPAPVIVEDVIDEVAGASAITIHERSIALHWNRPKKGLPPALCDKEALRKIVVNLMSNAVKYNRTNGHIEVLVSEADEDGPGGKAGRFLRVTVEDSGRGIPKQDQERVFARFFRSKNVMDEEIEGAGLGLYVASKLVALQGGRIWFESKEGIGTTFSFTVPAARK
jgi:signal transduction histidine kinase